MNRCILTTIVIVLLSNMVIAQRKFVPYTAINGVEFSTRWTHEKWYSKKSPEIFSIKVKNTTDFAVRFEFGVDFFINDQLVEENQAQEYCLNPRRTSQGKLNGVYFKSAMVNEKVRSSGSFTFELTDIVVEPIVFCDPNKKEE